VNVHGGSRQMLIHGAVLVLVGLVWGLVVPGTPHPRLALGAHIQLVTNGMLFIILATALLSHPHSVGIQSVRVMILAAWLTWAMALSEVANAWWGTTQMLPIAASQAGVSGAAAWQERVVQVTHIGAGLALIVAWSLLVIGLLKPASGAGSNARKGP
jgi:(hydroxyamino)benzene mutase